MASLLGVCERTARFWGGGGGLRCLRKRKNDVDKKRKDKAQAKSAGKAATSAPDEIEDAEDEGADHEPIQMDLDGEEPPARPPRQQAMQKQSSAAAKGKGKAPESGKSKAVKLSSGSDSDDVQILDVSSVSALSCRLLVSITPEPDQTQDTFIERDLNPAPLFAFNYIYYCTSYGDRPGYNKNASTPGAVPPRHWPRL